VAPRMSNVEGANQEGNAASKSDVAASILEELRALAPRLRERAVETERAGHVSVETIRELEDAGVFRMTVPVEYGGYDLSVSDQLDVIWEIAKSCGSTAWVVWVGSSTTWIPVRFGAQVMDEVFGRPTFGPRQAGSGLLPNTLGRARRVDEGWLVSGGPWSFATGARWAQWTNLGVLVEGEGSGDLAPGQLAVAEVETRHLEIIDDWHVMGMRGTASNSVALVQDEVFVPGYRFLPFSGFIVQTVPHTLQGSLWQAPNVGKSFSSMVGMSLGLAYGALDRFVERAAGRGIRGTNYKRQIEAPGTHLMLAEVHAKLRAAELVARANAAETDRLGDVTANGRGPNPETLQKFGARVLLETAYATSWCVEAIELLLRASGSSVIGDEEPIQRAWRDAQVVTLHGALNLNGVAENHGRIMAGLPSHQVGPSAA
jgi:alkylation response protein AidB-like acyl-CoA dehydrogenase